MNEVLGPKLDRRPTRALRRGRREFGHAIHRVTARRGHGCIIQRMPREPVIGVVGMLEGGEREPVEVPDHAPADAHPARYACRAGGAARLAKLSGTPRAHDTSDGAKGAAESIHPGFFQGGGVLFFAIGIELDRRRGVCVRARGLE
jgi:hypothetical protein